MNQIRAKFDTNTITVYQAYNAEISEYAVLHQRFGGTRFRMDRMTWIKPSFLWMMYRSDWATKENQENILAIKIIRSGFTWALSHASLTQFVPEVHSTRREWKDNLRANPVRVQWDPDRDILLRPLSVRAIQIGLSGEGLEKYLTGWISSIENITEYCKEIRQLSDEGKISQALTLLPNEQIYPVSGPIAKRINCS